MFSAAANRSRFFNWSIMDTNQIREILQTVKYPGFNRDIISFGMVQDIQIDDDKIVIILKISSEQTEKVEAVVQAVRETISSNTEFTDISVELVNPAPQATVGPAVDKDPFEGQGPLPGIKYIVAIASGKGGVGKSTVAANLAIALKNTGRSVGLLDLDIYGPSLPIIFDINERPGVTAAKKLQPLEKYDLKLMSFGFVSGNNAPAVWRGPMVAKMTEQFFQDVDWGELDYLVLDLPPGTGDVQLTLAQKLKISGAVMVTTPQDIALADVSKGADMFRKVETPVLGVVENMSGLQLTGKVLDEAGNPVAGAVIALDGKENVKIDNKGRFDLHYDLFKQGGGNRESARLDVPLLGEIPLSRELMAATDSGQPLVELNPAAPISQLYGSLAGKIITILEKQ